MHSVKPQKERDIYVQYMNSFNKKLKRITDLGIDINLDSLIDYVQSNAKELIGLPTNIVHGDFHPGNIIISSNGAYMIDLDVCKERNGIYDLASASVIDNYPAFVYIKDKEIVDIVQREDRYLEIEEVSNFIDSNEIKGEKDA